MKLSVRLVRAALLLIAVASVEAAAVKKPSKPSLQEHPLIRPLCGGLAACTAEALTLPIDVVKVRQQVSTETPEGFLTILRAVARAEGTKGLFSGLKPALVRQASYQSIKMYLYEPIRDAVLSATTPEEAKDADPKLWQMVVAGGLAGAIGTVITSPTDLLKIRMQSGVKYSGLIDALLEVHHAQRKTRQGCVKFSTACEPAA